MTAEELFEIKAGWAFKHALRQYRKVQGLVPDWCCPPQEEFEQAARIGLWAACIEYREFEHGQFNPWAYYKLRTAFKDMRREYAKMSTLKEDHRPLHDTKEARETTGVSRSHRRILSEITDAVLDGEDSARS